MAKSYEREMLRWRDDLRIAETPFLLNRMRNVILRLHARVTLLEKRLAKVRNG